MDETEEIIDHETPADEDQGADAEAQSIEEQKPPAEDEIDFVGFADEAPQADKPATDPYKGQPAPEWVRQTREENRELRRQLRELQAAKQAETPKQTDPGPRPTLAESEYDEDEFAKKLESWHDKKAKIAAEIAASEAQQQKQQAAWNAKLQSYQAAKTLLRREDYDEAEAAVRDVLSETQVGVLIAGTKDSASLVYALGKSPAKLAALKGLDPVETAFALARLESQVQTNRKPKISGETTPQGGTTRMAGGANARLEELERKAEKTGDRSEIIAYKRQLKSPGK